MTGRVYNAAGLQYGTTAWALRYLRDWGSCGNQVKPFRTYATILRWFSSPGTRASQLSNALRWHRHLEDAVPRRTRDNVYDLLEAPSYVSPAHSCVSMAFFLHSLSDGDIVVGGHTRRGDYAHLTPVRPGFVWLWDKWRDWFPFRPMPWPFWIFPRHPKPVTVLP